MTRRRVTGFIVVGLLLTAACFTPGCASDEMPSSKPALDEAADNGEAKPIAPAVSSVDDDFAHLAPEETARLVAQETLAPVMDKVEAAAHDDALFSHVVMDAATSTLVVYRVGGPDDALQQRLSAIAGPSTKIETRAALFTDAEAQDLATRIETDQDALEAAGVKMVHWGPNGEGGAFEIGVAGDPAAAASLLAAKYPTLAARLVVTQAAVGPAFSRTSDGVPFWGGDYLDFESNIGSGSYACSGGFGAKNANGTYMITAAHCNCPNTDRTVYTYQGNREGTWSGAIDRNLDAAYIVARTGADIFTDSRHGTYPTFSAVTSMAHPRRGESVCASGSFSRLRCGGKVISWRYLRITGCAGTPTVPAWYADQTSHESLIGEGDSGGPVFVFSPSTHSASARGIVSAVDYGSAATCAEGGNTRHCGWRFYFPDIVSIANRHGLTLHGF